MILIMKALSLLSLKKILTTLKRKKIFELMSFVLKINWFIPNFENCMDLLITAERNESHYVCIKDFDAFMSNKTKNENKKHFC